MHLQEFGLGCFIQNLGGNRSHEPFSQNLLSQWTERNEKLGDLQERQYILDTFGEMRAVTAFLHHLPIGFIHASGIVVFSHALVAQLGNASLEFIEIFT